MKMDKKKLFEEIGDVVVTIGIDDRMKSDEKFKAFVYTCLGKYVQFDWGDTCEEDAHENDKALEIGDRIFAVYKRHDTAEEIWIITEADRSVTTILFPYEY